MKLLDGPLLFALWKTRQDIFQPKLQMDLGFLFPFLLPDDVHSYAHVSIGNRFVVDLLLFDRYPGQLSHETNYSDGESTKLVDTQLEV